MDLNNLQPPQKKSIQRHLDEAGNEINRIEYVEEVTVDANGQITEAKVADNLVLKSGEIVNMMHTTGNNPVMMLGACRYCPSVNGKRPLTNAATLTLCLSCGQPMCASCRHEYHQDQNAWQCRPCYRRSFFRRVYRYIFYRKTRS